MAQGSDSFADFEPLLVNRPLTSPWGDGGFVPDVELLEALLSVPVKAGASQASGRFAKGVDAWTAHELRRAGFHPDDVWPRMTRPRVLARELRILLELAPKKLREPIQAVIDRRRKVLGPAEANVLGRTYTKQADVLIASWSRGPEVLVSTKTMLSSYGKNLRNRFEEAYGDAKNLRGRFPLLALGFLFVVRSDIPRGDLVFAKDMLRKLMDEPDVYDCAALIVAEWADDALELGVTVQTGDIPDELSLDRFLGELVREVMERTPVDHHIHVREVFEQEPSPVVEGAYDEEGEDDLVEDEGHLP